MAHKLFLQSTAGTNRTEYYDDLLGMLANGVSRYGEKTPFWLRIYRDGKMWSASASLTELRKPLWDGKPFAEALPLYVRIPNPTIWLDAEGNPTTIPDIRSTEVPNPDYQPAIELNAANKALYKQMIQEALWLCCTRLFPAITPGYQAKIDNIAVTNEATHWLYVAYDTKTKAILKPIDPPELESTKWDQFVDSTYPLAGEARVKKLLGL